MGVRCGDCGKILVPSETIPQLPHEPSAPSIEVEPTCTEPGESVIRCNHCGEYIDRSSVPALGHDYIDEITLNPTCTEDGVKTYICSNGCGETYTEVIPALGHNYIKDETESTEATCESAGLLVEICEICEDRKETTIEALGHKYTSEVTLEPTCEEDGVRTYTCNNGCGESYTEVISKLGHKQAIREENRVEPDCTNDGSYEKVTYCTECNEVLSRETIVLPALGHDYGD
jgi:phage FluMu protein Com